MKNTNPPCPDCGSAAHKHDILPSGSQRYKCTDKACGKRFTPKAKRKGRKASGNAKSSTERSRQWYANLSDEEKARRNRASNEARRRRKEGDS